MPEHDAAFQLNLAPSRQEVKRRNNKQHPDTFQNKTLRVDTSTQISKKRQTQAIHRPITAVISDYVIIAGTPLPCEPAVYHTALWWTQTTTGGELDQSHNVADMYPVEIGGPTN